MLFSFKGITAEQFKPRAGAKDYEDVGAWLMLYGTPRPAEIKACR